MCLGLLNCFELLLEGAVLVGRLRVMGDGLKDRPTGEVNVGALLGRTISL
jgi:hypothetical protein